MKSLLLVLLSVWMGQALGEICFEGKPLPANSNINVSEELKKKQAELQDLYSTWDSEHKKLDFNKREDQCKWQYISYHINGLIDLKNQSIRYNSECSHDAEVFFRCQQFEVNYNDTVVAYRKKYCEIDLSTRDGQNQWQVIARKLQYNIDNASEEVQVCKASAI